MTRNPNYRNQFADVKDFYRKTVFLPFVQNMIDQIETRLVQPEPYFRATWLLPSKIDFSLSNENILETLLPIFAQTSPYYEDVLEFGNFPSHAQER